MPTSPIEVHFFLPWVVEPKQSVRFRAAVINGKPRAMKYQPAKLRQNEAQLIKMLQENRPPRMLEGPLSAQYVITYPWLGKHGKKVREAGARVYKDTKPDTEQLAKQLSDCAERAGFFANDAQIANLLVRKFHGPRPGIEVRIMEIG